MKFDLAGLKVMLAVPVNRDFPWQTTRSLVETVIALKTQGIPFAVQFVVGSSIVEVARSKVAGMFLNSDCNRLLMLDSDQSWDPNDVLRLLAFSTKMDVIVGAYPAKKDPPTFLLSPEMGELEANDYGCLPVKGIGLGFAVVTREVIERLAKDAPMVVFPDSPDRVPHIFRCDIVDGVFRGEDMAFFDDVRAHGYSVWLDPALQISHVGAKEYKGDIRDALVACPQG